MTSSLVRRPASCWSSRGVDPDALTVPEMGLLDLGADAYREALDGVRRWDAAGSGAVADVPCGVRAARRRLCAHPLPLTRRRTG